MRHNPAGAIKSVKCYLPSIQALVTRVTYPIRVMVVALVARYFDIAEVVSFVCVCLLNLRAIGIGKVAADCSDVVMLASGPCSACHTLKSAVYGQSGRDGAAGQVKVGV